MGGTMTLIFNAIFLLGIASLNSIWGKSTTNQKKKTQLIYGALFSLAIVTLMFHAWTAENGIIYDTRTIVLGVVTIYFEPITFLMTMVTAVVYRLAVGGIGTLAGVITIVCTVCIAYIWKRFVMVKLTKSRFLMFWLIGLIIHIFMLFYHFALPLPIDRIFDRIKAIAPVILLVYPIVLAIILELIYSNNKKIESLEELRKNEEHYRLLFTNVPSGIIHYNTNGEIISCNDEFVQIIGSSRKKIIGLDMSKLPNTKMVKAVEDSLMGKKGFYHGYYTSITANKETFIDAKFSAIFNNDDIIGGIGVIQDLTDRKKAEEKINAIKNTCPITGLRNRKVFEEDIVSNKFVDAYPLVYSIISINKFQFIIDTMGYLTSEMLLKEIANILTSNAPSTSFVYKIADHDFAIISPQKSVLNCGRLMDIVRGKVDKIKGYSSPINVAIASIQVPNADADWTRLDSELRSTLLSEKFYAEDSITKRTIDVLMASLFEKSPREKLHSDRVSKLSANIARKMNVPSIAIEKLRLAARLHDIGKLNIDSQVLEKPSSLTDEEYEQVKMHSETGFRILSSVEDYKELSLIVLAHHEKYDGSGYPRGLKGKKIPFESRIICIADAFDAIVNDRPYRAGAPIENAIQEISNCKGTQFDPDIVKVLVENYEELIKDLY